MEVAAEGGRRVVLTNSDNQSAATEISQDDRSQPAVPARKSRRHATRDRAERPAGRLADDRLAVSGQLGELSGEPLLDGWEAAGEGQGGVAGRAGDG